MSYRVHTWRRCGYACFTETGAGGRGKNSRVGWRIGLLHMRRHPDPNGISRYKDEVLRYHFFSAAKLSVMGKSREATILIEEIILSNKLEISNTPIFVTCTRQEVLDIIFFSPWTRRPTSVRASGGAC